MNAITIDTPSVRRFVKRLLLAFAAAVIGAGALSFAPAEPAFAKKKLPYKITVKKTKRVTFRIYSRRAGGSGALRICRRGKQIYFSRHNTGGITRLWANGKAKDIPVLATSTFIHAVTRGPGNRIWFAAFNTDEVGSVGPGGGPQIFHTGLGSNQSNDIVQGPDGNVWIPTDFNGIGRITPAGAPTFFPIINNADQPTTLAPGPNNRIWFVNWKGNDIGNINTTNGSVDQFPAGFAGFSNSFGIAVGPDNRIYVADPERRRICRFDQTGGNQTCFTKGITGRPSTIIRGPDKNMYFGEYDGKVGRLTTSGKVTEYTIPRVKGSTQWPVLGMTIGPDKNIWFANNAEPRIGVMEIKRKKKKK